MTKTKTILGISFAAVFALSMILIPAYAAGHLAIDKTDVKVKDLDKLKVDIRVTAKIPKDGSAGAFGYGIFTNGNENVLALTTHGGVLDHPSQVDKDDPVMHAHVLDLMAPSAACIAVAPTGNPFEAEVNLTTSGDNFGFGADFDVKVKGKKITVNKVPVLELGDLITAGNPGVDSIATFTITPLGLTAVGSVSNLCLDVKTSQP